MNINSILSNLSRNSGGMLNAVSRLNIEYLKYDNSVALYGLKDKDTIKDISIFAPLIPIACSIRGPSFIGYSPDLKRKLLKINNDIIHIHGLWRYPQIIAYKLAYKNKTPYCISPHGMLDPWALKNSRWKKIIVEFIAIKKMLKNASCIHALCESEYQSIRAYGLTNPVAIIPNGIDLPIIKENLDAPWQKQVFKDKKVMLFLGRIHPKKGLEYLIKAWTKLKPDNWVLVIAGWNQGNHEDFLKQLVSQAGMEKDVIFLGPAFDEKKQSCLQNADAFILPSFSEGLPMSVLEAWSYNLPVIMTKECNIPEGFKANAAIKIQPEISSIYQGLQTFFSLTESEQKKIGINGYKLIENQYTWSEIGAQMINVYKWILDLADKPKCIFD